MTSSRALESLSASGEATLSRDLLPHDSAEVFPSPDALHVRVAAESELSLSLGSRLTVAYVSLALWALGLARLMLLEVGLLFGAVCFFLAWVLAKSSGGASCLEGLSLTAKSQGC